MLSKDGGITADPIVRKPQNSPRSPTCKIALYGFGSHPVVLRHLVEQAAKRELPLKWCAILPTPHFRSIISEVLPAAEILDVFRTLPRVPVGGDLACLSRYPGSLLEDLAAQKRRRRRRNARWLLNRGIDYFKMYKGFFVDRGVTHLLMPLIETPEAKIAVAAARELGLGVIAPVDMRNITGTLFSTDCHETPPSYAVANNENRAKAAEFIESYRKRPGPAQTVPAEIASRTDHVTLSAFRPPLWRRVIRSAKTMIERPDIFDPDDTQSGNGQFTPASENCKRTERTTKCRSI